MKQNNNSFLNNNLFLGKKTKNIKQCLSNNEIPKKEDINKDSIIFESSTDLSMDNLINLEEKYECISKKVPGLDDIKIPSFFNDITKYKDIDKKIKNYFKTKKELGSNELAKLYLIDINRLYEEKKKI